MQSAVHAKSMNPLVCLVWVLQVEAINILKCAPLRTAWAPSDAAVLPLPSSLLFCRLYRCSISFAYGVFLEVPAPRKYVKSDFYNCLLTMLENISRPGLKARHDSNAMPEYMR